MVIFTKITTAFLQTDPNNFNRQQDGRPDFLIAKGIPYENDHSHRIAQCSVFCCSQMLLKHE